MSRHHRNWHTSVTLSPAVSGFTESHKNGLIDKQRLSGERWNRWVALGLDQSTKKSGGSYQKDDRATVFRISKDGAEVEKNALELLLG